MMLASLAALVPAVVAGAAMLEPGDRFPAWELKDQTGAVVSSNDLVGSTYLLWYYPKAMSSGCTAEGCALRDSHDAFEKIGVVVLGISFDDPQANAKFAAEENFPFRLLSDGDKDLAVQVGAADSRRRMWPRRISYLVGPNGRVLKAYASVDPRSHAGQVLEDLEGLASRAGEEPGDS